MAVLIDLRSRKRTELASDPSPRVCNPLVVILSNMASMNAAIARGQVSWWEQEYRAALLRVWGPQAVREDDGPPSDSPFDGAA